MRILVVEETDWLDRAPHDTHHLFERLSAKGHEIRVIDFEIRWREHEKKELISSRKVFEHVHKAIDEGNITIIRPSIIKMSLSEPSHVICSYLNR